MTSKQGDKARVWRKVLDKDELGEGRVMTKGCGLRTLCMTHHKGEFAALDNRCPHQGGPLGEGSIENGLLRCPWHGWDYDPISGKAPGFDDGVEKLPIEVREDGIYVALDEEPAHERTVTDVMAETMVQWGVTSVFGMVGHSNLGLADALRRQEVAGELSFIGIRHEGAASFAASAYGKLTGRPAACLAIAGPGATNLLTGLWDAHVDRSPVIALTGQVDSQVLGPGAFQEVDLVSAFGGVAQWTQPVLDSSRHAELMTLACKSAILNRGVSHLIFPDEVQTKPAEDGAQAGSPKGRLASTAISPSMEVIAAALELIQKSKRPLIIVGHGARFDMPQVTEFAEHIGAPVITTFKGKGLISDEHPLACGVLGRSGTPIASYFMNESDCLIVLGASFSNHTGITPKIPTIQVDFDAMILGKFHAVEVPVWGEIEQTLDLLMENLDEHQPAMDPRGEIATRWGYWRAEKLKRAADDRGNGLDSASIFAALSELAPEDAILAVDVGNNAYSFGRYFEVKAQSVLMSGYLGSIGFALPAAMGAWAATQEDDSCFQGRKVISVSGDAGLGQYLAELTTAVKYNMNITHVLLNNSELGKISKEQRAGEWDVWQTKLHNPNFAAYAELCGAKGIRVSQKGDIAAALREALAHPGPSLVEFITDVDLI